MLGSQRSYLFLKKEIDYNFHLFWATKIGGLNTRVFLLCITYCYPIAKIRAYLERENTLVISLHEHVLTSECLKDARIVYFMIRAYFAKIGGGLIIFCMINFQTLRNGHVHVRFNFGSLKTVHIHLKSLFLFSLELLNQNGWMLEPAYQVVYY